MVGFRGCSVVLVLVLTLALVFDVFENGSEIEVLVREKQKLFNQRLEPRKNQRSSNGEKHKKF
jgi:hypothetical protein